MGANKEAKDLQVELTKVKGEFTHLDTKSQSAQYSLRHLRESSRNLKSQLVEREALVSQLQAEIA